MPRVCPHCKESIPVDEGFSFDEKLNLICGQCGKIAFATASDMRDHISTPTTLMPRNWGTKKELEPEDDGA